MRGIPFTLLDESLMLAACRLFENNPLGHWDITVDGVNELSSLERPSDAAVTEIATANEMVDVNENTVLFNEVTGTLERWFQPTAAYHHEHHFDRPLSQFSHVEASWQDGLRYLRDQRTLVTTQLTSSNVCQNVPQALVDLGKALHALQDAYSHSNYVDESTTVNRETLDRALLLETSLIPSGLLLTLFDGTSNHDNENPNGRCSKDQTPTKENYCHEHFAKDSAEPNNGFRSVQAVDRAYAGARTATKNFVQGIAREVGESWQAVVTYQTENDVCRQIKLSPNSGLHGQELNVSIAGESTHFESGTTSLTFGPDVSINALTIHDARGASAQVTIGQVAQVGGRLVTVVTGDETARGLFTIEPFTPRLTRIEPTSAPRGTANLSMTLFGRRTHFASGTVVDFGSGINIDSVDVLDPTRAVAHVSVEEEAGLGPRNVTVTTGPEVVSLSDAFTVVAAPRCGQGEAQTVVDEVGAEVAFDSDASGRSQICLQTLADNLVPLDLPRQITSGGAGQQQAQQPQWSLAASAGTDTLGRIAYQFGAPGVRAIHLVKPDGSGNTRLTPTLSSPIPGGPQIGAGYPCADARDPSWSPDGRFIVYACLRSTQTTSNYDLWVHATRGTPDTPNDDYDFPLMTRPDSLELRPAWSPNGLMIAFVTNARGYHAMSTNSKIAVVQVRSGEVSIIPGRRDEYVWGIDKTLSILTDSPYTSFSPTWSPDSQAIAFSTTRNGARDIYRMSALYGENDGGTLVQLTTSPSNDINPSWSSDGQTIAFASDRNDTNQIYAMSAFSGEADAGRFLPLTTSAGNHNNPSWRPQVNGSPNALTVVVTNVTVASGVAAPTGRGTVMVADGFGRAVADAIVTLIPPPAAAGTLGFAPSSGMTDQEGTLSFTVAQPTAQASADYTFTVTALDKETGKIGTTTASLRVSGNGAAPSIPGGFPVPPETRLPVGRPVFRNETKQQFTQIARHRSLEALLRTMDAWGSMTSSALDSSLRSVVTSLINPFSPPDPVGDATDAASDLRGLFDFAYISLTALDAAHYLVLANDPPDYQFTSVAVPEIVPLPVLIANGAPVSVQTVMAMNRSVRVAAVTESYLRALVASLNRYSAAIEVGDLTSAALQRNAILAYEDALVIAIRQDGVARQIASAGMRDDGFGDPTLTAGQIAAVQAEIAANGLPAEVAEWFRSLGWTDATIETTRTALLAESPPALARDLSVESRATSSEIEGSVFGQASGAISVRTPLISITGGTFSHDGRPHAPTAIARGVGGIIVPGTFSFTYTPGGTSAPVSVGTYSVGAVFTSADPSYSSATGSAVITILPSGGPAETTVATGAMNIARIGHQATVLNTGLVLVSGGQSASRVVTEAELFNPSTGRWTMTGASVIPRLDHSATLLADGRVLAVGGVSSSGDCTTNATAETYDPASGTWSLTGRLPAPAGTGHIAVRLADGRVLVAGGGDRCGTVFSVASLFNPSTNQWTSTGSMTVARQFHSAALLKDGKVLVAGGIAASTSVPVDTAEVYDPATGAWTAVGSMTVTRGTSCNGYVQPFLAALSGGSVLAASGFSGAPCAPIQPQRTIVSLTSTPTQIQFTAPGQTQALAVLAQMSDGSSQPFTGPLQFTSDDTSVARVDAAGIVTAIAQGQTVVTISVDGVPQQTVAVTVEGRQLMSFTVGPGALTFVGAGQIQALVVNGRFSDGSQQTLTTGVSFVSAVPSVAAVSQTGVVTSAANGTGAVTVSVPGLPSVQVPVTVKSLASIVASAASLTLGTRGQTHVIQVTGIYSDGSQQIITNGVSFVSSNPSVARVDASGVVTATENGAATITASTANVPFIQVTINVAFDPLTSAEGRVVTSGSTAVSGAVVTCAGISALTFDDGRFSITGLPTVPPLIACTARRVTTDGSVLSGSSTPVPAVSGGVTTVGDIAVQIVAPVPAVSSITPNVIDALHPPATVQVAGSNLSGATFSFLPEVDPAVITVGAVQINAAGTAATLSITVAPTARGRFTLVGTNAFGEGNGSPAAGNTITLINAADDVDSDGDGFPDGLELLFGSDPSLAASTPNLRRQGDASSQMVSIVNRQFPVTSPSLREAQSLSFSVVNRLFPLTSPSVREAQSLSFSVVNRLFPSVVPSTQQVQSLFFGLLNDPTLPPTQSTLAASALAAAAPGVTIEWPTTSDPLIEGQTVVVRATVSAGQTGAVDFTVDDVSISRDLTAPYEMLFTVPSGVTSVTLGASAAVNGSQMSAAPITLGVVPDLSIAVTGRVVDSSGNPVAGAIVEILSEGVDAELFDSASPLSALPNLAGRVPDRVTRLTAINILNPGRVFGEDPLGSRLLPDFTGRLTGWLDIRTGGVHTFVVGANEGARLSVGGTTIIDMMGSVSDLLERQAAITLQAGLVPFELQFYQSVGNGELRLSMAVPAGGVATVSPSLLVPGGRTLRVVSDQAGRFVIPNVPTALASIQVRASTANGVRTGTAIVRIPPPLADTDVGDVVLTP